MNLPGVRNYGNYSSDNYGAHTLVFTDERGYEFYFSYRTLVAFWTPDKGLVVHENDWSTTTGKHLNWIDGGSREAKRRRLADIDFRDTLSILDES